MHLLSQHREFPLHCLTYSDPMIEERLSRTTWEPGCGIMGVPLGVPRQESIQETGPGPSPRVRWEVGLGFALKTGESVAEEVRRIAREQIEGAVEGLQGRTEASREEVVHDARKRFKRVRALLRLARGGLIGKVRRREDARFRDLGRSLASSRDAEVLLRTFEHLVPRPENDSESDSDSAPFAEARTALEHHYRAVHDQAPDGSNLLESAAREASEALEAVEGWPFFEDGWSAIAPGLRWIYRGGRRAARAARRDPCNDALHDWRKRVKDYWHALEVLGPIRPEFLEEQANQTHRLADLLGDDHDLAVLLAFLNDPARNLQDRPVLDDLSRRIDESRAELRREAFDLGQRSYRDRPSALIQRFHDFWRAWQAERRARSRDES
ncbi:CHAD domain-containing protein [soil metagenome]